MAEKVAEIGGGGAPAEDLRVQRTRAALEEALFALTVEKGYAAVTVRDLARRARVNRSTFYRHYLDRDDLLGRYFDDLQARVVEAAAQAERGGGPERLPAGLLVLVRQIQGRAAFFTSALGPRGTPLVAERLRRLSEQRYRHLFAQAGAAPGEPPSAMRLAFISSAFVGAVRWWLEAGQPSSAEDLARWLGQLSRAAAGIGQVDTERS